MARFTNAAANAFSAGYDLASPNKDKSGKTAYQRYIEKYYGPGVTSHSDPLALARAATGAVEQGLKSGAGFLSHAAAGLLGAPMGSSQQGQQGGTAVPHSSSLYGGRGGGGAVGRMPSGNQSSPGAGLSSPGPVSEAQERFFNAISEAEGTTKYGYNTVYGGANGIGGRPLTSMTLRELTDYQKDMIPRQGASPMGKFQINRRTVLHHATKLGLDLDKTVFDETTQKKLALSIAGEQGIKPPVWDGFRGKPKLLSTALQAYSQIKGKPIVASAYASTDQAQTPAQQAAAAEAAGRAPASGSITDRGERVAAMQRDLNSRGAKLTVDGLEGPLTRAAQQQFYGSPTSVRTPGFTNPPATSPQATSANNWSSLQGSPTRTVNQRQNYVPTPSFTNRQSYTSGRGDEGQVPRTGVASTPYLNQPYTPAPATPRTPYLNQPYTPAHPTPAPASYTSGRGDEGRGVPAPLASIPRRVPTESISGPPMPLRPFQPRETAPLPRARPAYGGPEQTPQTPYLNQPYTGPEWDVLPGPVVPATPYLHQPYTMTTGGANAIVQPAQAARLPRARPDYQAPQEAVPTLIDRLGNLIDRAERVLGGNRGSDSRSSGSSSRSGGGGNYSGGNYGGQGGSRINEGVGGSFKNR